MIVSFVQKAYNLIKFRTALFMLFSYTLVYEYKELCSRLFRKSDYSGSMYSKQRVSLIITVAGEGLLTKDLEEYDFQGLQRLLKKYLPGQIHQNYEAIVYASGPNKRVEALVHECNDSRIAFYALEKPVSLYGHPQTRKGILLAQGDYFVRMSCDNRPYSNFLSELLRGFRSDVGFTFARVVYKGIARNRYREVFLKGENYGVRNELCAYVIPRDKGASLAFSNIDCMNYMVKMDIAKRFVDAWSDAYEADWLFIEHVMKQGVQFSFQDTLIGEKW